MDVMQRRRLLMAMQKSTNKDLLHYATRIKTVIPGGNGSKNHIDFDFNAYYSIMSGRYYLQDTGGTFANITDGIITINSGLSSGYGPAFPVQVEPNCTYVIHGEFTNCTCNVCSWTSTGDQINAQVLRLTDGDTFTTGSTTGIVTIIVALLTRYSDCYASNITLLKV